MPINQILVIVLIVLIYVAIFYIAVMAPYMVGRYLSDRKFKMFLSASLEKNTFSDELLMNSAIVNDINPIKREFIMRDALHKASLGEEPFYSNMEKLSEAISNNSLEKEIGFLPTEAQGILRGLIKENTSSDIEKLSYALRRWKEDLSQKRGWKTIFSVLAGGASIVGCAISIVVYIS